jgi:hypothetical protein
MIIREMYEDLNTLAYIVFERKKIKSTHWKSDSIIINRLYVFDKFIRDLICDF